MDKQIAVQYFLGVCAINNEWIFEDQVIFQRGSDNLLDQEVGFIIKKKQISDLKDEGFLI